ncbi:MAG: hypothetical protein IH618_10535 [Ignavibacteriaceae bacterium]|nr:hypothetical protein [Ignavibacteriaceae bacterium]
MKKYNRFSNDPRWIDARFGECSECKTPLKVKRAFYYPLTGNIFCPDCGSKHSADFNLAKQDEDFYNSQYGASR